MLFFVVFSGAISLHYYMRISKGIMLKTLTAKYGFVTFLWKYQLHYGRYQMLFQKITTYDYCVHFGVIHKPCGQIFGHF